MLFILQWLFIHMISIYLQSIQPVKYPGQVVLLPDRENQGLEGLNYLAKVWQQSVAELFL